jgi:hypothetical protein
MRILALTTLLMIGVCAQTSTAVAQIPGLALRWDSCFSDGASHSSKTFACDTNAGSERLVGTFSIFDLVMENVTGNEIVVDLQTGPFFITDPPPPAGIPIPEWWKFVSAGNCRRTSLTMAVSADPDLEVCPDWAAGQAVGGIGAYTLDSRGPGSARIIMATAVPPSNAATLFAGIQYFSFSLTIRHDKTVGAGACGGCDVPIFLIFNRIHVVTPVPASDEFISGPINGSDADVAVWTPLPVPTRRTSWGAVKSLFH